MRHGDLMHLHENPKAGAAIDAAGQPCKIGECNQGNSAGYGEVSYRLALACSAELCAASASLAEIAAVSAAVPQLGASLPSPQARGR
jgi:hypothetical protein